MAITPTEAQILANLIPRKTPAETYTIAEALEIEPKLKARYDTEPNVKELLDQAQKLEGLTRHAGKHAAGIVISEGPLWDHVPVFKDEKSGSYVTQYDKDDVEKAGLVKFDFLGLKTLTVLDICATPHQRPPRFHARGEDARPFDASPWTTRRPTSSSPPGETKGVFQLESSGHAAALQGPQPDCFEDIVAAVALYRPGPLGTGMVEDFVNRKHGQGAHRARCTDMVDELLAPTYGVIVYQEQVMQIAQASPATRSAAPIFSAAPWARRSPRRWPSRRASSSRARRRTASPRTTPSASSASSSTSPATASTRATRAAYALITYQTA